MKNTPDNPQKALSFCRTALCYVKDAARIEFRTRKVVGQAGYAPELLAAIDALETFLDARSTLPVTKFDQSWPPLKAVEE